MSNPGRRTIIESFYDRRPGSRVIKSAGSRSFPKVLSVFALVALAVLGCVGLSSCGGGSSKVTTVTSVTITAASTSTPVNGQITFTATVNLSNSSTSTTTTVSWEVNAVAGGSAGCGTIVPFPTDQLQATYNAPGLVPTSSCGSTAQLGQVAVTAVATQTNSSSGSSSGGTVTSNTVIITIGSGLGLSVTPASANVPAGGTEQFAAFLNGVPTAASWVLTSTSGGGGSLGVIDGTGLYTAPPYPPAGASVTITATVTETDGSIVHATSTALIAYSDHSLKGPYAFSYTGNDAAGFLAVAGSFVSDGNGKIVSGVEDIQSLLTGTSAALPMNGTRSTYSIGSDGRGTASVVTSRGTTTWSFVLSTNQHGEMIRFDTNSTGAGSIDQQSLNALANSTSPISGRYAFALLGLDGSFNPLGMAGEIPAGEAGSAVLDVNDNGIASGTVTKAGAVVSDGFAVDTTNPSTGRGTFTLQGATACTVAPGCTFAYYAVSTTTNSSDAIVISQLHLVEIDGIASLAGDMYLAASSPGLADATFVFKAGGNSSQGAFASGGVFESDGVGATSNGVLDINNAGTYNSGPSLGSCTFASDASTGRIDLKLFVGSGTCPGGSSPNVSEFAAYPTALGSVVMLQLDSSAVSTGLAFQQCGPQSAGCATASPALKAVSLAMGLDGQGLFHSPPASSSSFQPDLDGEVNLTLLGANGGNLDINNFGAIFQGDPLGTTGNSLGTPASNGRGTASLAPTNPAATYNLVYYLIDDNTALLLSSSQTPVAIGTVLLQF